MTRLITLFIASLLLGLSRSQGPTTDLVFIIDESGSMGDDQAQVQSRVQQIFRQLAQATNNSFRVGLVGFSTNGPLPRKLGTLTNNETEFAGATARLVTSGSLEPGFTAVARTALDNITITLTPDNITFMDGTNNGSTFPGPNGFCAFLISDDRSNSDEPEYNTVEEVKATLDAASNSPFFGVVRQDQLNPIGNTYGALANQTGGTVTGIVDFRANDTAAQEIINAVLRKCAQIIGSCETNGPYLEFASSLPASIRITGSPTCGDGSQPLSAEWSSRSAAVTFSRTSNPAMAVVDSFGEFEVCQSVTCAGATGGENRTRTCCTTLSLREAGTAQPTTMRNNSTRSPTETPRTMTPTSSTVSPSRLLPNTTSSPTTSPKTMLPTSRPFMPPTSSPTKAPQSMMPMPTVSPSRLLPNTTSSPTTSPNTMLPTSRPFMPPTSSPTKAPQSMMPMPTVSPSGLTMLPTGRPSVSPTRNVPAASNAPSRMPRTNRPTRMSARPTSKPTGMPSPFPTRSPPRPTDRPTMRPRTSQPTLHPTMVHKPPIYEHHYYSSKGKHYYYYDHPVATPHSTLDGQQVRESNVEGGGGDQAPLLSTYGRRGPPETD